ncbi:MAG: hypothetical protein ACYSSN_08010 [Planctomycetota bacterium]|jgi:hypothetical protein
MNEPQKKTAKQKARRNILRAVLVVIALSIIVVSFQRLWPEFPFLQRRFTECDPNKAINLIKKSFDITLPDNISSAKAAETRTSWLEHNYIFILSFTTDLEGWEQFHTSFPKIKDQDTIYGNLNGSRHVHDVYDFTDYDPNEYEPRIESFWGWPKWFKAKIRKGKHYYGHLYSKDSHLQIKTICIDLSDPEKVVYYIEGGGPYDASYGLD